jgi:hypothetical protein
MAHPAGQVATAGIAMLAFFSLGFALILLTTEQSTHHLSYAAPNRSDRPPAFVLLILIATTLAF